MMGDRLSGQEELFYNFSLERFVPNDHILRSIDRFIDLESVRVRLKPYYSETGRPSVCPELMIRMLLVGYLFGIRSERRLCEEVHVNLAYRWFCRLGLDGAVPDHSTFSKARHGRFRDSDLFRQLFDEVVEMCLAEGLVGGEGFAVDGSLIKADADRRKGPTGEEGLPKGKTSRAITEYLATLDDAAFGAATKVTPKFLSKTDPAARYTGAHRGPGFYAYTCNYMIDNENAVIVDVEATSAIRQAECTAAKRMLNRTEERHGLYPARLAADTGYGSAEMLAWLVEDKGIEPHIPVFEKGYRKDDSFGRDDFPYDHKHDRYICPAGKELLQYRHASRAAKGGRPDANGFFRYRAQKADCDACPLKPRCCPSQPMRKVLRHVHEGARDMAREIAKSDEYIVSRRERKKVEMLFAHLKRILKLGQLRLRGPTGARDEFHLAAIAQNLRKLAKLRPIKTAGAV
ncbi:MAG: IS1182 family transposase [Pseudomonadota bacterium]